MKKRVSEQRPYGHNPDIVCHSEYDTGRGILSPGSTIRFKNIRGTFTFHKYVTHSEHEVAWIDCMDNTTGEFRSIYADRLKPLVRKRSVKK